MKNLILQYPSWYILLCVFVGIIIAGLLYYKSRHLQDKSTVLRVLLTAMRFIVATSIAFLLLEPLLRLISTNQKDPQVLVFVDRSQSVIGHDSLAQVTLEKNLSTELEKLGSGYKSTTFYFADDLRSDTAAAGLRTNMEKVIELVNEQYSNENIGAVVIASDGLYNDGLNPLYVKHNPSIPIYTIGMGDTSVRRDVALSNVFHNNIAYKGDKMSLEIDLSAHRYADSPINLKLYEIVNSKPVLRSSEAIKIDKNQFFTTKKMVLEFPEAGVRHYRAVVSSLNGEYSLRNNSKDFFIRVIETKKRVGILAHSPHPDVSAIKQVLESNKNFEVEVKYPTGADRDIKNYDLVILHQLPSSSSKQDAILGEVKKEKKPCIIIQGKSSSSSKLNSYQDLVSIQGGNKSLDDAQISHTDDFSLFELSQDWKSIATKFPPLKSPFGKYSVEAEGRVLAEQRIGNIETDYPLITYGEVDNWRVMLISGEGVWRWKLYDYLENKSFENFKEWLEQSIQYLTLKKDNRFFRTDVSSYIIEQNQTVKLSAELYNEAFDPINNPDVNLTLRNEDGKKFEYLMDRTESAYKLSINGLKPGSYSFSTRAEHAGRTLQDAGKFIVKRVELETQTSTADWNILKSLSEKTGGKFFEPAGISNHLSETLRQAEIKPVIYQNTETRSILELKWLFFLIFALLALEWFMRRVNGAY